MLPFLKEFKKTVSKFDTVSVGVMRTHEWLSTGNYALNRALSGSFKKGIPLHRLTGFVGPSGAGKSFISSNVMVHAQTQGYHLLVLDSENALDVEYLEKIGLDVSEEKMTYAQVTTIEDVNKVCAEFFAAYRKAYGKDNPDAPKTLIVLDSLAMLSSSTEIENYTKDGTIKADQGILAKRRKAMLRMIVGNTARLPIAFILTDHVYPQDIMMGDGAWAVTNSTKFSLSIIGIVTKLKLKEEGVVTGVRMRFETYKSRFAKLGTKVELEVPYNKGMSPFSGLVPLLEAMGVIAKGTQPGEKQKFVTIINGNKIAFKESEINEEIAMKLFEHPLCADIEGIAAPDEEAVEEAEIASAVAEVDRETT